MFNIIYRTKIQVFVLVTFHCQSWNLQVWSPVQKTENNCLPAVKINEKSSVQSV